MLRTRFAFGSLLVAALLTYCSSNSTARVRVQNATVDKANISLKDQAGNTTNINDVSGGTTSAYQEVDVGPYTITGVVQNETNPVAINSTFLEGKDYTVKVAVGTPPVLSVLTP
jgi:hypothetical protein